MNGPHKRNVLCHICNYPIPHWVISPHHPLSYTRDHIIPLSKDGVRHRSNTAPAHRFCNNRRGNLDVDYGLVSDCRLIIVREFYFIVGGDPGHLPMDYRWYGLREAVAAMSKIIGAPHRSH